MFLPKEKPVMSLNAAAISSLMGQVMDLKMTLSI